MEAAPFYVFYAFAICFIAAILYLCVNEYEPNRALALLLKLLVITASAAAMANQLMP